MELPVPTRLPVRVGHQTYVYELRERLGPVPHGTRYAAVDVSSDVPPEPGAAGPQALHAVVFRPADAGHAERAARAAARFIELNHPALLAVYALGACDGPAAGAVALITEPWGETLTDVVARDRALTDPDLLAAFDAVSGGLLALHHAGWGHGELGPATVVRTAGGWRLAPGHPARGADDDLPADVAAAAAVFRVGLGLVPPVPAAPAAPPPAGPHLIERFLGWATAEPGRRPRLRDVVAGTPAPAPAPPPAPAAPVSAGWLKVLDGCAHPDPGRRWKAERLVFGADDPPAVDEFRAEAASATAFRLTWAAPARGRVEVYDLGDREAFPFGAVTPAAAVAPLGAPVPRSAGGGATVQLAGDQRRLQITTALDDRGLVVFGSWVVLSRVPDVGSLRLRAGRDRLHLTWDWPADVHLAYVVTRGDRYPAAADDGQRVECLRTVYEANGRFELPVPAVGGGGLFVTVFAAARVPGGVRYGPGARVRLARPPLRLRYHVRRAAAGLELVLTPNQPGELPGLVLVAGPSILPLHPADGTAVARVPAGMACRPDRPAVVPVAQTGRGRAKLFCERPEDYDWLELTSDPVDGVRLG